MGALLEHQFIGLSPEEIKEQLENESIRVVSEEYVNPFIGDEEDKTKQRHGENGVRIQRIMDEIDTLTSELKEEKKDLQDQQKEFVKALIEGGFRTSGKLYHIVDHLKKVVEKYNEDGLKVGERPMTEEDNQLVAFSVTVSQ